MPYHLRDLWMGSETHHGRNLPTICFLRVLVQKMAPNRVLNNTTGPSSVNLFAEIKGLSGGIGPKVEGRSDPERAKDRLHKFFTLVIFFPERPTLHGGKWLSYPVRPPPPLAPLLLFKQSSSLLLARDCV